MSSSLNDIGVPLLILSVLRNIKTIKDVHIKFAIYICQFFCTFQCETSCFGT